jgi:hypothetical protein
MGLGSGPMIGFDPEGVSREFGLIADEIPVMLVAVGYGTPAKWPLNPRCSLLQVLNLAVTSESRSGKIESTLYILYYLPAQCYADHGEADEGGARAIT